MPRNFLPEYIMVYAPSHVIHQPLLIQVACFPKQCCTPCGRGTIWTGTKVWDIILTLYIGPGQCLSIAGVCREWRQTYTSAHPKITNFSALAVSPAMVQWALDCGCPKTGFLTWRAAECGSLEALQCAVAGGCEMSYRTCESAAYCWGCQVHR
jgi:hypothetical protein